MEKLSCAKTVKAQSKKCQNKLMCTIYFKKFKIFDRHIWMKAHVINK